MRTRIKTVVGRLASSNDYRAYKWHDTESAKNLLQELESINNTVPMEHIVKYENSMLLLGITPIQVRCMDKWVDFDSTLSPESFMGMTVRILF